MPTPGKAPSSGRALPRQIAERVERELGVKGLASLLSQGLSPTDLQSLLLEVYRLRVARLAPRSLVEAHVSNRFVRPSPFSPAALLRWDALAWASLPEGFEAIELAPVCPLGSVSALAPLSQDWSISTSRNTEVVSDGTNVLALECAARRLSRIRVKPADTTRIHLAASHRVLRGQRFREVPGVRQHFRLFALCSAGRDPGGLRFETEVACQHIEFYVRALRRYLGREAPLRVAVADLSEGRHRESLEIGVIVPLRRELGGVPVGWEDATPAGAAYYRTVRFHVYATHPVAGEKELVDGGAVDWGQRLLSNQKERTLISGIGTERLVELFGPKPG